MYSIFPDLENYTFIGFDRDEIRAKFGRSPKDHVDLSSKLRSYKDHWQSITVNLSDNCEGMTGDKVADIIPFKGKLFLSQEAYKAISPLIKKDGEFLPVIYEKGDGYIFNPLRAAEDVDGLNTEISHKNTLDEIDCMAFHEERVKSFAIFKSAFDRYQSVICQQSIKDAIESAGLGGVYFTLDLGNQFTSKMKTVSPTH